MNSSWLDKNRHILFIVLALAAIGGAAIFYLRQPPPEPVELIPAETTAPQAATPAQLRVHVTGAVYNSDVYFLPQGSIVKDAIIAAGGFTTEANREGINQALELQDQQQIFVPFIDESKNSEPVSGKSYVAANADSEVKFEAEGPINLNTATLKQLETLPGIGPAIGQRIIDYRESVGRFQSIEEIKQVQGIGEATFAKIKDSITVD